MNWKCLASVVLTLLPAHWAFRPASHAKHHRASLSSSPPSPFRPLRASFDEENDFYTDSEGLNFDDDDTIDLSNQDWRSFRAKLVQSESSPSGLLGATPSCSRRLSNGLPLDVEVDDNCIPESGDCDLDGIGALFGLRNTPSSARSGSVSVPPAHSSLASSSVQQQQDQSQQPQTPWAYDSGKLIETGAVLLGGVEQEFGFGLRQQYFHKAAILVLDHSPSTFTKGIILNRPSDMYLEDDINPNTKWRVWFGGDVQGLDSQNPDIVCLHSLKDPRAKQASISVMKDIQWTTFDNAKRLVKAGVATPQDFWVFCGYAGWGSGQLLGELERNSWYMVATDSQTLLQQLARQSQGADPRDAGLETWSLLMDMIGRGSTAKTYSSATDSTINKYNFDDLMLKEWAHQHLLSAEAGGGAGRRNRAPEGVQSTQELMRKDPVDRLQYRAQAASLGHDIVPGSLVRASSQERSPYLLQNQELHKSVILILSDDEHVTVGAILNRPAAKGLDIRIAQKDGGGDSRRVTLPLRFGGQYSDKNKEPLVWLHCNSVLRAANIGEPLGPKRGGIWKCTAVDVTNSVGRGLASPEDFFVVTGVTVWTKGEGGLARGMQGEIRKGNFEVVPDSKTEAVWDALSKQEVLTNSNVLDNLDYAQEAWDHGGSDGSERGWPTKVADSIVSNTFGRRKNDAEQSNGGSRVFKSNVPVSNLSDDALRRWVSIFLLGNISP